MGVYSSVKSVGKLIHRYHILPVNSTPTAPTISFSVLARDTESLLRPQRKLGECLERFWIWVATFSALLWTL